MKVHMPYRIAWPVTAVVMIVITATVGLIAHTFINAATFSVASETERGIVTSPATIDMSNSGRTGFKWYTQVPFGSASTPASDLSVANSVLTINQSVSNFNYAIGTMSPTTQNGQAFQYGYFEARMAFNPADGVQAQGFSWPSFWAMSKDYLNGKQNTHWGEVDFFEAYHEPGKASENQFLGTLHDWLVTAGKTDDRATYGNHAAGLPGQDLTQWHTYGCAWTPTYVKWYFDNKLVLTQNYSATSQPVPNTGNHPAGTFNILNTETGGQTVVLGSGIGYPMKVDWVRIWK